MPTIYLKDATFSRLVDSGHYHDYEKVIAKGVDLVLELEELEKRQVPKSEPGPLPEQPEESPESTFTTPEPAPTVTEDPICAKCNESITDPLTLTSYVDSKGKKFLYHKSCMEKSRPWTKN